MRSLKPPHREKTQSRRDFSIVALAGLSALAVAGAGVAVAGPISREEALKALDPWVDALFAGDPAKVEKVLAPEFQILRSDGSGHDKTSYLKYLPQQRIRPQFSDIVATGTGDVMVLRYRIETDLIVEGKEVKGVSPRLSVFRREAGMWLICAHANFAPFV
jgi:hypothetical protein